jgi:hypothetical protein
MVRLESSFFWMLRFDYTPLFWKVKDAVKEYNRLLYLTMKQLIKNPGTLKANATSYHGNLDEEGLALLEKANKNPWPTREEMRELAHTIALYLANSPIIHKFVIDYWNLRANLIQGHIYALKMAGQVSDGPGHVIIQQKIDRLEEKKGYMDANYSKSCALHVPVVKREIKWVDSDEESSNAEPETEVFVVKVGDFDKVGDSDSDGHWKPRPIEEVREEIRKRIGVGDKTAKAMTKVLLKKKKPDPIKTTAKKTRDESPVRT